MDDKQSENSSKLESMTNGELIFLIVCVLFVVFLGVHFFVTSGDGSEAFGPVDVGGGFISISDQDELGHVIFSAEVARAGHVTIHKSITDAPADIIGVSRLLSAGSHKGVEVILEEPMKVGDKYIAILHVDDGDGYFEVEYDMPVMVDGEVVRPDFRAVDASFDEEGDDE
jgi:hypothetical protein